MRPSEILSRHIDEVRATVARFPVSNPRVFGSAARGDDVEGSDLDLLVDALETTSYFDLAALEIALEDLLGLKIDIGTAQALRPSIAERVLREAKPI